MFFRTVKKPTKISSELSVFVRSAKSREKKKIYKRVIDDAIREQNAVVRNRVA